MPKNEILDEGFADSTLEVYEKFHSSADAKHLILLLKSNAILHKVETPKPLADPLFVGEAISFVPKVFVKLRPKDFTRVNQLVEADMLQQIQQGKIDLDQHFFQEFTNAELWDVVRKPDEWNYDAVAIAKYLLESRGVEVSTEQVDVIKEERVRIIRKPRKGRKEWIFALYLVSLAGFLPFFRVGIVTTIICLGMGYYYWQDITIDPNGEKFYTFDAKTRNSGKLILNLAVGACLASVAWYFVLKS